MTGAGFGSKVVLDLTGITYRQLDYWARTGLVGSSIRQARGPGSRRVYSFEDLVALRVVARLLDAGVSLQGVRRAVRYLKWHADRPLTTLGLIADGRRIFVLTEDPIKMIEATAQGQAVIAIDVEPIVKNLKTEVTRLSASREVDVRVRGHAYRAVFTPDLEAGGYSVEVPDLPGCITEGDTLPEARRMAREAMRSGWRLLPLSGRAVALTQHSARPNGRMAAIVALRMIKAFVRLGWSVDRASGSHHVLTRPAHPPITIPVKKGRTLKEGTARAILRQAGVSEDDFFDVSTQPIRAACAAVG